MTSSQQTVGAIVPNWNTKPLPSKVVLQGNFCTVEPLSSEKHAVDLFESFKKIGDELWAYTGFGPFNTFEEYRKWVDKLSALDDVHFAIISKETGHAVGQFCLQRCDAVNGTVEVGYVLFSLELRKTTMATEAHYLLMRYVFEVLGYRRYEWRCNSLNERSRKAALRLGFQFEGTFRQAAVEKGGNRNTMWFSIIDKEWIYCRSAFEKWLDVKNFEEGKQKLSLGDIRNKILVDNN